MSHSSPVGRIKGFEATAHTYRAKLAGCFWTVGETYTQKGTCLAQSLHEAVLWLRRSCVLWLRDDVGVLSVLTPSKHHRKWSNDRTRLSIPPHTVSAERRVSGVFYEFFHPTKPTASFNSGFVTDCQWSLNMFWLGCQTRLDRPNVPVALTEGWTFGHKRPFLQSVTHLLPAVLS